MRGYMNNIPDVAMRLVYISLIICMTSLQGCSTLSGMHDRGQGIPASGWGKAADAAWNAIKSPGVWGPSVAAVALQYHDMDGRISDWATRKNPVFGSQDNAAAKTDIFEALASVAFLTSFIAVPEGDTTQDWTNNKMKRFAYEAIAIGATGLTTLGFKSATHRKRPDASNDHSLTSGDTSNTAVLSRLAMCNLDSNTMMPQEVLWASDTALYAIEFGAGWSRVEAKKHYPSDVLAGMALGNFMANFFCDALLGSNTSNQPA